MSSRPKDRLWPAEPHTIAKIEIVRKYAFLWAKILGRSFKGRPLTYIDGFAGPGEYTNHEEGSPTAALTAFCDARSAPGWIAGLLRCVFIESDQERFLNLSRKLEAISLPPGIVRKQKCCTFVEGMNETRKEYDLAFSTSAPLLVFVDPFGATGAPFEIIADILSSGTSEVILNFDADGVARIWSAGAASKAERNLQAIFGCDAWRQIPWESLSHRERCFKCAKLYKDLLLMLPGVEYAFSFEMGAAHNRLDYFLIFASKSVRGLEKMKEVMQSIDQTGDFRFYDTNVHQLKLMRFDDPEMWIEPMVREFAGLTVDFREITRWVMNETPFFKYKASILKPALDQGWIETVPYPGQTVRKGTFPDDKVAKIRFLERSR